MMKKKKPKSDRVAGCQIQIQVYGEHSVAVGIDEKARKRYLRHEGLYPIYYLVLQCRVRAGVDRLKMMGPVDVETAWVNGIFEIGYSIAEDMKSMLEHYASDLRLLF